MSNKLYKYELMLPHVELGDSIPKRIYQILIKQTGDLDPDIQQNINYLKELNPGWEFQLFRDQDVEDFILAHYGEEVLSRYQRISLDYAAARADLFRYLLLYIRGGVYLDLKSSMEFPLDQVLQPDDKYILSHWDNLPGGKWGQEMGHFAELNRILPRGEWQQWHVISAQGHPFLREVIKNVLYNIDHYHPWRVGPARYGVLRTTGPVVYSLSVESVRASLSPDLYRIVDNSEQIGLEYSIFNRPGVTKTHHAVVGSYYMKLKPVIDLGYGPIWSKIIDAGTFVRYATEIVYDKCRALLGLPPTNMT